MNKVIAEDVRNFLLRTFSPGFGDMGYVFSENPQWEKIRKIGTELWLDTANIRNVTELWTKDFTAVTTNTTLLAHEMQQGVFDALIKGSIGLLSRHSLSERELIHELGFILRAEHALRTVEKFDSFVSIEAHIDYAQDADALTASGERLYELCPERFIVSVPYTSSGIIAARRFADKKIPVNITLGFSARQNYIAARLGRPAFVSVFVGRLSSLVRENALGSGEFVGEKAALASQRLIRELQTSGAFVTRQIGAGIRNVKQVTNLAGIDILTMPPAVADSYRKLAPDEAIFQDRTQEDYTPGVDARTAEKLRFETLWDIPDKLIETVIELEEKFDVSRMQADQFETFFTDRGFPDLFPCWTPDQEKASTEEGKRPDLSAWEYILSEKITGLDSLMTFAGINSLRKDQKIMDARIAGLLREHEKQS